MLIEMYQGVAVDGSSAYIRGHEEEEEGDDATLEGLAIGAEGVRGAAVQEGGEDGFGNSPMSTSSRKRGSNTCDQSTASSPGKKSKSPVVKLMRGLLHTFSSDNEKANQLMSELVNAEKQKENVTEKQKEILKQELLHCQRLVVECGAAEDSAEYFCATQLFRDENNRMMFQNISSPEARLMWLKRWCRQKKLY